MTSDEIKNASSGQIADMLSDYNNWRRGKPPYDEPYSLNLSARKLGLCIDRAIEILRGEALNTKSPENGNNEKVIYNGGNMREALGVVIDACDTVFKMAHDSDFVKVWAKSVRSVAIKAISKPPRNCDIGTASDMAQRFKQFCHTHCSLDKCCDECPLKLRRAPCEFEWSQMTYEKGETK